MVVDTYLIYKYRVKRSDEFPEDEPGSYEALEFPEQNRALRLPRATHQRYSQPSLSANGRKRLIHFDDMIYPQQSNSFFSRLRSGVVQAFGSSSTTVIGSTYLWNLLPALRFSPIGAVTWKIMSLIGSFRDRSWLSSRGQALKPKSSATTNLEFFNAVFEVSKKFAEGSESRLKGTLVCFIIYKEIYRNSPDELIPLLQFLMPKQQDNMDLLLQEIQQVRVFQPPPCFTKCSEPSSFLLLYLLDLDASRVK